MNTTHKGTGRFAASILPIAFFLLALICIAQAAQLTTLIASVRVGIVANYDTILRSGWQSIDEDANYEWIGTVRGGTGNYCIKVMGQFNGVAGDTLTLDSTEFSGGYENYVTGISGDSLMDLAWSQWTSYNAAARTALKLSPESFKYQMLITVRAGTGTPVFTLSRYVP